MSRRFCETWDLTCGAPCRVQHACVSGKNGLEQHVGHAQTSQLLHPLMHSPDGETQMEKQALRWDLTDIQNASVVQAPGGDIFESDKAEGVSLY